MNGFKHRLLPAIKNAFSWIVCHDHVSAKNQFASADSSTALSSSMHLEGYMKLKISMLFMVVSLVGSGLAWADADDVKWIAQCIKDNKNEGAKEEVVYKYCACMNNK